MQMQLRPYRDPLCQNLASSMLLQVTFNYVTAMVFYVDPGSMPKIDAASEKLRI